MVASGNRFLAKVDGIFVPELLDFRRAPTTCRVLR